MNDKVMAWTSLFRPPVRPLTRPPNSPTNNQFFPSENLVKKLPRPPGGHVFQPTETIFTLIQDIIGTNLLTRYHEDQTINIAPKVLKRKNALTFGCQVFQAIGTNFFNSSKLLLAQIF
ncbi:hypothetical protein DPMN_025951 [Dreissena polymorpha]|uniref:Uncharacterized protein n=1 Tax=Dreissena polymorpha TaxID=45954 RepID=A0A9D4LRN2_DREPO|nr:hypothetical protein DPMN_025951 [Dreissena polymorpha]